MKLRGSMTVTQDGALHIGGVSADYLAERYGTPLLVLDHRCLTDQIDLYRKSFTSDVFETEITYASKAFLNHYMAELTAHSGLGIDAIGEGDLRLLEDCGFPMDMVYLHGNAKSDRELRTALELGVGRIVVDNITELQRLRAMCERREQTAEVLIRLNPKVVTDTHRYLQTALASSKFGISIEDPRLPALLDELKHDPYLSVKGIHCHIGSQISDGQVYLKAAEAMLSLMQQFDERFAYPLEELNMGGGFGIGYTKQEKRAPIETVLPDMLRYIEKRSAELGINLRKVLIEPGRSIVGEAGTTLYRVQAQKTTESGRRYLMVDGGMTDNPRTALYGAVYEAAAVNHMDREKTQTVAVAGKCCESGDILIEEIRFPEIPDGAVIAVSTTGAYNYAMSSNYNGVPRPAIVVVKDGEDYLVTKREKPLDIHRNDIKHAIEF